MPPPTSQGSASSAVTERGTPALGFSVSGGGQGTCALRAWHHGRQVSRPGPLLPWDRGPGAGVSSRAWGGDRGLTTLLGQHPALSTLGVAWPCVPGRRGTRCAPGMRPWPFMFLTGSWAFPSHSGHRICEKNAPPPPRHKGRLAGATPAPRPEPHTHLRGHPRACSSSPTLRTRRGGSDVGCITRAGTFTVNVT